jgi:hypothetical protein
MLHRRMVSAVLLCGCVGFAALVGCMPFGFSLQLITPKSAESTTTTPYTIPTGAGVKVVNEIGSTQVTVDPNATEVTVEVRSIALAGSQDDANSLLAEMQVTVTEPNDANEVLLIEAKRPAGTTLDSGEFNWSVSGDEMNITAIAASVKVALFRIRITLPAGHAVQVEQEIGKVLAAGLDMPGTLRSQAGSIRSTRATASLTARAKAGSIAVENHTGSLDLLTETGGISVEILGLGATDAVSCTTQSGGISLTLPSNINAKLTAQSHFGRVNFWAGDFDTTSDVTDTRSFVEATLGTGGATIDAEADAGSITIAAD